jgi:hypothetical protein
MQSESCSEFAGSHRYISTHLFCKLVSSFRCFQNCLRLTSLLHMWPTFPFGGSQHPSTCSSTIGSEFLNDESSLLTPVLLFSKLKLQHVVQQWEIQRQVLMEQYDCLFADLAQSCLPEKTDSGKLCNFPLFQRTSFLRKSVTKKQKKALTYLWRDHWNLNWKWMPGFCKWPLLTDTERQYWEPFPQWMQKEFFN